jgi:hypothetical protein
VFSAGTEREGESCRNGREGEDREFNISLFLMGVHKLIDTMDCSHNISASQ